MTDVGVRSQGTVGFTLFSGRSDGGMTVGKPFITYNPLYAESQCEDIKILMIYP